MEKFNVQEVFDRYEENSQLDRADIFHLYDTGENCVKENTGYHDSRHFILVAYNSHTMQKRDLGRHDGIINTSNEKLMLARVYADGSFFLRMYEPVGVGNFQCIHLM